VVGIADSVTVIGEGAFEGCLSLPSLQLPSSLVKIGNSAFWNCESLQTVGTPPPTLALLDAHCFGQCYSLQTFDVSQTVLTSVETSAFTSATSLQTMHFPPTLRTVREVAFWDTQSLRTVTFDQAAVGLTIGSAAFFQSPATSMVFPNSTTFAPFALVGMGGLRSITALAPGNTQGTTFTACACNVTCPAVIANVDLQMCDCLPCVAGTTLTPHTGSNALAAVVLLLRSVHTAELLAAMAVVLNNVTEGSLVLSESDVNELATVTLDIVQVARVVQSYGHLTQRLTLQMADLLPAYGRLVQTLVINEDAQSATVDSYIKMVANFSGEFSATGADQSTLALPLVEILDTSLLNATKDLILLGSSGTRSFTSPHSVVTVEVRYLLSRLPPD
jgi:hypothetical protein